MARLKNQTTQEVINHTRSIFARHGIPEVVISDNGPQYSADLYATFAREHGFEHVTSSPHYPQGNGAAERAVRTVKGMLRKSGDPNHALLAYRSTPLENGYSPAQLLMSRNLRTTLPITRKQRKPEAVERSDLVDKEESIRERQKNLNQHHRARELPQLEPGNTVWIPDRGTSGTVVEETAPCSHIVGTTDGTYRRNRRHLIQMPEAEMAQEQEREIASQEQGSVTEPLEEGHQSKTRSTQTSKPPERYDPSWT